MVSSLSVFSYVYFFRYFFVKKFSKKMSSDVPTLAGTIAVAMTADHLQYFEAGAKEVRGMYLHRIHRARGHAACRGWARLLLDRRKIMR